MDLRSSLGKMHVACNRSNLNVEQSIVPHGSLQRNRYNTKLFTSLRFLTAMSR